MTEMFLSETPYIDFSHPAIQSRSQKLFTNTMSDEEKVRAAYFFVRDEIPHSFDIESDLVPVKASAVLLQGTGICHAKANLLAAFLRGQGIPAGFCFEHITLAQDDKLGYCVHGFNAVYVSGKWIKLDARGNKKGIHAEFSLDEFIPAFPPRDEYDEYFYPGAYADPSLDVMVMLEMATSRQEIIDMMIADFEGVPDVEEEEFY